MNRFEGKVAVVTGAGSGIGKGAAARLAREGATIVAVDRNNEAAEAVARELASDGRQSLALQVDVADYEQIQTIVPAVVQQFGRIDVLVQCAGMHRTHPILDLKPDEWDQLFDINTRGLYFVMQAVARQMIEQKYGRIINIASVGGKQGNPYAPHYAASKAAVISLSWSGALAFAAYGVTVNAVCPGFVDTPMSRYTEQEQTTMGLARPGQWRPDRVERIPMKRTTTPEEVAGLIAYLASEEAAFVTGQSINIDGGAHMD